MPGMDGFEATAAIRGREETRRIPIVALTAHAMTGDRDRCLKAGMDAYVAKPVEAEELFATIEQLASGKKREEAEERPREASADVLDRDTVLTRLPSLVSTGAVCHDRTWRTQLTTLGPRRSWHRPG